MFTFLYKTYVRPHLDYCSSIWSAKDIDILEKAQKRATRLIKGFDKLPYDQRLKSLDLVNFDAASVGILLKLLRS